MERNEREYGTMDKSERVKTVTEDDESVKILNELLHKVEQKPEYTQSRRPPMEFIKIKGKKEHRIKGACKKCNKPSHYERPTLQMHCEGFSGKRGGFPDCSFVVRDPFNRCATFGSGHILVMIRRDEPNIDRAGGANRDSETASSVQKESSSLADEEMEELLTAMKPSLQNESTSRQHDIDMPLSENESGEEAVKCSTDHQEPPHTDFNRLLCVLETAWENVSAENDTAAQSVWKDTKSCSENGGTITNKVDTGTRSADNSRLAIDGHGKSSFSW